uniref:Immunoglobulin like and fibronectin type III domain containing 1 n=1 Tax=Corvus moneduloides TaxID=1196302 RepID=A0A8U7NG77_CORMO
MKYGIVDFRGMLRKLQEIRKDTETEQDKFIHSLRNFEHIKVNKEGNATFSLEMELKSRNSKVYLLKDGERLWYGTGDEYRKHCLRRVGRRYRFTINDVQPEDAGVYQVRVEDIPIFSTELDAQAIPVRFRQPLSDVRCAEAGDAEFQCVLCTPCHEPLWLHKSHLLQASDKHQISVTPDGLTHKLIVRNAVPSDSGLYTLDAGQGSSSAWLLVEYAKGKRRQDEGEKIERETSEWLKETMADNERARKLRRQEQAGDEDHPSFSTSPGVEKTGWYRTGQGSSQGRGQGHSIDPDDGSQRFLGKEGLRKTHINGEMGSGQFSGAGLDGDSGANDGSTFGLKGLGGRSGLRAVHGMDAVSGRAGPGGAVGGAGEWNSVDGRGEGVLGAVNIDMDDGEGLGSQHDKDGNLGDASYRAGFGGAGRLGGGSSVPDGLDPDSTGVGASVGDLFSRTRPGTGAGGDAAGAGMAGRMRSHHGKDGHPTVGDKNGAGINREGQTGTPYGKDGLTPHASGQLGQAERSGSLYVPGGLPGGDRAIAGAGGNFTGEMEALYGPDGQALGAGAGGAGGAGVGGFGAPYGKDGLPAGAGGTGAWGLGSPYGKDGLPVGAGIGGAGTGGFGAPYGKDGLPVGVGSGGAGGTGGLGAPYGKDGLPAGAGSGGAGRAGGLGAPYGKDGLPVGTGTGGAGGAGGLGAPYGKDGLPVGVGTGGAGAAGGLGAPYGKDGLPVGVGTGGAGGAGGLGAPYGKDGLPAGAGSGGAGGAGGLGAPYGKDGLPVGAGAGGAGGFGEALYGPDGRPLGAGVGGTAGAGVFGSPYGKDGLPVGTGTGGAGGAGGLGAPYGKDGLPVGAGTGGAGGAGGLGAPYGKDGLPVGVGTGGAGGAGGLGAPYGKDGLPVGAGTGGAGGAGGLGAPYGKDGLPVGAGTGGAGGAGGLGAPYGKDGLPVGAGTGAAGGAGGLGAPYGKDGLPVGAGAGGAGGAGGLGAPYGKDGLPVGAGSGGAGGVGVFGSPYGKDGLPVGAGIGGAGGAGGLGAPYGKDGLPVGAGTGGAGGAGGLGAPYGKDGLQFGAGGAGEGGFGEPLYGPDGKQLGAGVGAAGAASARGLGAPYGKDGLPVGGGAGGAGGAGGLGAPYGKDGLPVGGGAGGAGGAGGLGAPYGKDGLPVGGGAGGAGGAGGLGAPYGKDGLPTGPVVGGATTGALGYPRGKDGLAAGLGVGGAAGGGFGGAASPYGMDGFPAGGADAGGLGAPYGKDGLPVAAGAGGAGGAGGPGTPYGKDGLPVGAGIGGAGGFGEALYDPDGRPHGAGVGGTAGAGAGGLGAPYGKDGLPVGTGTGGAGGAGGLGAPYGKDGLPVGAGIDGAGGAGGLGAPYGKDGLPVGAGTGGAGGAGGLGAPYGKDGLPVGAGAGGAGTGGFGAPYGKDGLPVGAGAGGAGAGGLGAPYGKDGLPVGAGAGGAGTGGFGAPYVKDGLPVGVGTGAAGGAGGLGAPYGKDGLPAGAGAGGAGGFGEALYGPDGRPLGAGVGGTTGAGAGVFGSPYGKDGLPVGTGTGGAGGAGGLGAPYGKDGLPVGVGTGGAGGAGGLGAPYGKDGLPVGVGTGAAGGAGGLGAPYGKDGLPVGAGGAGGAGGFGEPLYGPDGRPSGAGIGGAGAAGVGGLGSPYGKDGLPVGAGTGEAGAGGLGAPYGKDGLPAGAGAGGAGRAGGLGAPYGKDGLPAGAGAGGAGGFGEALYGPDGRPLGAGVGGTTGAGAGVFGAPYGKDGLPVGTGTGGAGGAGGLGAPYGKDGLPVGAGAGGAGGAGGLGAPYGKDGLPVGAGIGGAGGAGGLGAPYGKDGLPVGAGSGGAGGAGGLGAPYGKDGLPVGAGAGGSGGVGGPGSPYGKDGLPAGTGIGGAGGAGGLGAPYGKDGLPVGAGGAGGAGGFGEPLYGPDGRPSGAGVGGAGVAGVGGLGSPYGKDGLPAGAGGGGAGGAGVLYGKDGFPAGAVAGAAHFPPGGEEAMGSGRGRDATLSRALGYAGGGGGEGFSGEGSALWGAGSLYGKDRGSAVARADASGIGRLGGDEQDSVRGKGGVGGAGGPDGEYGLDARLGRSLGGETGKGTASDVRGPGNKGSADDRGSLSGPGGARGEGRDFGQLGSLDGTNSAFGGAGSKSHDRSVDGSSSGGFGQGPLSYGQMSGPFGGPPSANQRKQEPDLDLKANDSLNNTESTGQRKRSALDDLKVPRCYLNKQLATMRVLKGDPAELSCTVSRDNVTGTWFKDGLKLTSMDGVIFERKGLVHKLIINKAEDIHAGKYRFEGGDVKTEASIFVEDPPQVDKVLLKNLTSVPMVAKAGEGLKLRIPFEGRGPIRATWLKDRMELGDDTRIRVDKTDTCTTLSISSCDRRDCGDYKVRLKNDSGVLEINLKLVVIDKPQPPAGPIKIVESSASNITIQWKPPKDDGGKPVQRYLVERQQMGRNNWETLGETPRSCTSFTTSKVEEEMSYYFRVRAMNAEGVSDALESGEVKAAGKASPGAPDPPKIISASRDTITISWKAPRKTGTSQIMGYIVQKRKKGTVTWLPVTSVPVKDKKLKVTGLKEGVQYEFRVAAVNAAGTGQPSDPSEPSFARDPTKSPGQVQDLKVSSSDSTSVTLTWNKPEVQDGNDVKGYEVEKRPCNSLSWTKCFTLPAESTSCRVQGLRAGEKLFLRVRALSDSGPGEASELEACAGAAAPAVSPRLLIDDTVKRFLVIKAGNPIRVKIPFEGSPEPVVTWLKDGLPLPSRAAVNTEDGSTQLLLRAAELSDSGTYTVELGNGLGKRETFSFQVQITDIPQPPGAIRLEENVPNTVTVTWDPSASEKWEKNLYYTVLKRESQKGLWHVLGDLIYNNKFTFTTVVPGRDYYFRVVAKNDLGASDPSETVKPWRIWKTKAEFRVKAPKYRGVNQNEPPRFLVPLKPHVVVTGSECHMSCAVGGHPPPKITWYKDSRDLSGDPNYFCTNDFGVCSLVVLGATKQDEGEYMVEASNEAGRAFSKAFLAIKDSSL